MPDETAPLAPGAPAPAPEAVSAAPAPVVTANSPAPPAESSAAPDVPVAAEHPVAPAASTVLGEPPKAGPTPEAPKTPDAKPVDAKLPADQKDPKAEAEKPPVEAKKEEGSQSDEPAPLPSYEPFVLPEGIALDEAKVGEFTKMLGEFETTNKADHAAVQALGQQLVERHLAEVKATAERIEQHYQAAWTKQTQDWLDAFKNDPEIGGNRQETTTAAAREFIRRFGGTTEQQTEFRTFMDKTGIGNHPAMIRMFANANLAKAEGKPIPARAPAAAPQGKLQKMYGPKKT